MNMRKENDFSKVVERVLENATLAKMSKRQRDVFEERLNQYLPSLADKLFQLYGGSYDYFYHLEKLVELLAQSYADRKTSLKKKDDLRLKDPLWYRSERLLGMALYVDLFAGDLSNLIKKIPYLQNLGVNYVHLMPLYKSPEGNSDGGYAVSDYRGVDAKLGTEEDLVAVADAFDKAGISLVLDFVFNHTSNEHEWALKARQGIEPYNNYYYFFEDKREVDEYNSTCREIFPTVRRGSFTYLDDMQKWVWTTFNSFQWDLNFSNPEVFNAITGEMLFLANVGCDALRLDALAFVWKEKWTSCESQPKAHTMIQCFNDCLRIVAPAVVFKSEAIVHPDEVEKYIGTSECQTSYNPLAMALMWESLATRETKLLTASLKKSFQIAPDATWVNYIRCHDDIGWTFDDELANGLGINGYDHRHFLNQFYTDQFEGAFAQGVPFQQNPVTGDCRVCGSLASLAGLEKALASKDKKAVDLAVKRVRLLNSINLSLGGVALLYQGDELGLLNDYSYEKDPNKVEDSRWVHRPKITDKAIKLAQNKKTPQYQINQDLQQMVTMRKENAVFGVAKTEILETYQPHLFSYARLHENGDALLAICNFSEYEQAVPASICDIMQAQKVVDMFTGKKIDLAGAIKLNAYDVLWLKKS